MKIERTKWFNRKFASIDDNGMLPSIAERLAGTPARCEEIVEGISENLLIKKMDSHWSIKEHIGHLADLEELWLARLEGLMLGEKEMRAADLTNSRTHNAGHNAKEIGSLLNGFRQKRKKFLDKLNEVTEAQLNNSSLHPRLRTPMRITDLAYFVAEHDDHHLADIRQIINKNK